MAAIKMRVIITQCLCNSVFICPTCVMYRRKWTVTDSGWGLLSDTVCGDGALCSQVRYALVTMPAEESAGEFDGSGPC